MSKYLKKFDNHTQYEAFIGGESVELYGEFIKPNVSYCEQENEVHYNPYSFADEYLTMIAREDGTITFKYPSGIPTTKATSISYSVNDAEWVTTSNVDETEVTVPVRVVNGDKVRWKGDNVVMCNNENYEWVTSNFVSDCEVDINGNIMSLLYGDDFKDKIAFNAETQTYVFAQLFGNYDGFLKVVNAKNLSLPATTLAEGCYSSMFLNCTSLTTAPELPATTLANNCYQEMFYGCTSLVNAPELPVTTLAERCYSSMFQNCTSLTTAPELPATTLANNCYENMFDGCTSLTTAPELPATTLAEDCYACIFYGCTSLNYIKAMFTTTPSIRYTMNWVQNVSATGTFVKNSSATWNVSGINGIPNGWTIETATA